MNKIKIGYQIAKPVTTQEECDASPISSAESRYRR